MKVVLRDRLMVYGLRILVLYLFSVVFKSFDLSFPARSGSVLFRSEGFSLLFVIFGLLAWAGGTAFARGIEKKTSKKTGSLKVLVLVFGLFAYGLLTAYLFSFCYALFDVVFFGNYMAWSSFASFSYDLIFGLFMFYLLILAYNGTIFYYKSWQESRLNEERLRRENIQAKYDVLRSQVDPHFFFNSLSVLTNLVYQSADLSAEYITQLAKSYRYILDKKFENLVPVKTELEFLESYSFLIRIRHQDSIEFDISISEEVQNKGMLPPATLQMLVENAVKHNRFSAASPLRIAIHDKEDTLFIVNDFRKRYGVKTSIGLGLDNISKRYELTSDRKIEVIETTDQFIVKIPIIKNHEGHHIRG